ncbi:hydrogenase formation protein HypD [Myxococcota bacterium]|nr:hydrogenase formation protein HypD [Myxococcota bacterium]
MKATLDALQRDAEGLGELRLMEVCGTHTVALFRTGVRDLLPSNVRLISGPGCPVCVTSQGYIDAAIEAAASGEVTLCTYGDMLRVPGQRGSLEALKARGARVVVCYSIRDALKYAQAHPKEQVMFLAVGFETTTPASALAVLEAARLGLERFTILSGHKLVMPAIEALLADPQADLHGFLLPGHVSVILGASPYRPLVDEHGLACAIAGFEPQQLIDGVARLVAQIKAGAPALENVYRAAVRPDGNPHARAITQQVFVAEDTEWRAMGVIPNSGLALRDEYAHFDAFKRFSLSLGADYDPPGCLCGQVIQGRVQPPQCPHFGKGCTLTQPIGPCMVSSEGTCAAWFKYARRA